MTADGIPPSQGILADSAEAAGAYRQGPRTRSWAGARSPRSSGIQAGGPIRLEVGRAAIIVVELQPAEIDLGQHRPKDAVVDGSQQADGVRKHLARSLVPRHRQNDSIGKFGQSAA